MNQKVKDYYKIREYCSQFNSYQIYDYLFFVGITNIKNDIKEDDLLFLMDKCSEVSGEYTDPIEVGQSLASEVFEEKNITLEQLKSLTADEFNAWYNDGREVGNSIQIEQLDEKEMD